MTASIAPSLRTDNIELKKLVYLYVMNYAKVPERTGNGEARCRWSQLGCILLAGEAQPELAILAINTFRKATDILILLTCCGVVGHVGRMRRIQTL